MSYRKVGELSALRMDSASRRVGESDLGRWIKTGADLLRTMSMELDEAAVEIKALNSEIVALKLDLVSRDQSLAAFKFPGDGEQQ